MDGIPLDVGTAFPRRRGLERDGAWVPLTQREADLLHYLARAAPRAVSVGELLTEVWGLRADTRTHTVQTVVYTLRRKLERVPGAPRHLLSARGEGYRLVPRAHAPADVVQRAMDVLAGIEPDAAVTAARALLAPGVSGVSADDRQRLWLAVASIRQRQGRVAAADEAVRTLLALPGGSSVDRGRAWVVAGLVAWRQGRGQEAAAAYARATPLVAPDDDAAGLAAFNASIPRWRDAGVRRQWRSLARHLGRHDPRAATVALAVAHASVALGDPGEAHEELAWAHVDAAAHPLLARLLEEAKAVAHRQVGDAVAAEAAWTRARAHRAADRRMDEPFGWGLRAVLLRAFHPDEAGGAEAAVDRAASSCPFTGEVAADLIRRRAG